MKLTVAKYFKINFMSISPSPSIKPYWPFHKGFGGLHERGMQVLRDSLKAQNCSAPVCQIIRLPGKKIFACILVSHLLGDFKKQVILRHSVRIEKDISQLLNF